MRTQRNTIYSISHQRLRLWIHAFVVAVLLAGLIPPVTVRTLTSVVLPATLAAPLNRATTWLPDVPFAQAATVQSQVAAPLSQIAESNLLTITKTVMGSGGSGPFNIRVRGSNDYSTTTTVSAGIARLLSGLDSGVYTLTETSPGAGWTTIYTTSSGYNTGNSVVVTLTNPLTATRFMPTGPITGTVYTDYNSDGNLTADGTIIDTGVPGVTVSVYDSNGSLLTTTLSAANGQYTFPVASLIVPGPYRLEFSKLPSGYEVSRRASGTQNGTSVQFITVDTNVARTLNFGVLQPCDYCQNNPELMAARTMWSGLTTDPGNAGYNVPTLVRWPFSYAGFLFTSDLTTVAVGRETGTVFGLAYARQSRRLYSAALTRRHVAMGPGGAGAIYLSTPYGSAGANVFATLPTSAVGIVPSNAARFLPVSASTASTDTLAMNLVGKSALGDIDLSEDEKTLYVVALGNKHLYGIDTPSAAMSDLGAIPDPGCVGGAWRPFGLEVYRGALYIGGVCDAEISQSRANLNATVYRYQSATFSIVPGLNKVLLNYTKGSLGTPSADASCPDNRQWNPYTSTLLLCGGSFSNLSRRPQPILSDLEFDVDGSLILAFADRNALQGGETQAKPIDDGNLITTQSGGDILRAYNNNGIYQLETNGSAGTVSGGVSNGQGPGGGEFYQGDFEPVTSQHHEISLGGLAAYPGSGLIPASAFDPVDTNKAGVMFLSNSNGAAARMGVQWNTFTFTDKNFNKGASMGDLELLCNPAPIEIGNRLWWDQDGDGVQDAGEPGINGILISLRSASGIVTTTTSGDGNWYFGNLNTNTSYTITINTPLPGYNLTTANTLAVAGASASSNHPISDVLDSDAALVNNIPTIYYSTGSVGQSNHGLDFGVTKPVSAQVDILNIAPVVQYAMLGDYVWEDINYDGQQNDGLTGINGVAVALLDNNNNVVSTTVTFTGGPNNSRGYYTFTNLSSATYHISFTLPTGYQWTIADSGNDTTDSDGVPTGNVAVTGNYTLTAGQSIPTVDQGVWRPASLQIVKAISGGASSDTFTMSIAGPANYLVTTTVTSSAVRLITGLVSGLYTVTETLPPTPPSDAIWGSALYTPTNGTVNLSAGTSGTVTVTNRLLKPHLSILKTATPTLVRSGDLVTYTIVLTNDGGSAAYNVVARDRLPAELEYVSHTVSSGSFVVATGEWILPVVPPGKHTLLIIARVQ